MKHRSQNDTSLAFVDIITNGLGGMLVLFFILVMVQTELEWAEKTKAENKTESPRSDPFVLIVQAQDNQTAFDAQSRQSLWQFEGVPAGMIAEDRGVHWDWGSSHAVFVADEPLGMNSRASVRTPSVPTTFQVDLYPAGGEKQCYLVKTRPGGTWTEVWPAVNSR